MITRINGRNVLKDREWREQNKERRREYNKQWHLNHPEKRYEYAKKYREKYPEKHRQLEANKIERHRLRLFSIIQDNDEPFKCVQCGIVDIRVLQIDHKDGHGSEDKKRFGGNGNMYTFYRHNPELAREKLQLVCANCNIIRRHRYAQMFKGVKSLKRTEIYDLSTTIISK